jgi:hypothetical protein
MRVFLFRPSPQVPRPSVRAAIECYDASEFNIHMQRKQIETGSVDLTWIFTQSIFMAINTILWSLSYSEIRRLHPREEVEGHLSTGLEAIQLASERWPGVLSALELYRNLIDACMKIYDKDGDVPIAPRSPSDSVSVTGSTIAEGAARSRTTSPATVSNSSIATPPDRNQTGFGYFTPQNARTSHPLQSSPMQSVASTYHMSPAATMNSYATTKSPPTPTAQPFVDPVTKIPGSANTTSPQSFNPNSHFNPMPSTFPDLVNWSPTFSVPHSESFSLPPVSQTLQSPGSFTSPNQFGFTATNSFPIADYLYEQSWGVDKPGSGLTQQQHSELMHDLETSGSGQIETMIQQSNAIFGAPARSY